MNTITLTQKPIHLLRKTDKSETIYPVLLLKSLTGRGAYSISYLIQEENKLAERMKLLSSKIDSFCNK